MNDGLGPETSAMYKAGFVWDPPSGGAARWTHVKYGMTALRQPWMGENDWLNHCAEKITESRGARLYDEVPLGTRFRYANAAPDSDVFVKLENGRYGLIARWRGVDESIVTQGIYSFAETEAQRQRGVIRVIDVAPTPATPLDFVRWICSSCSSVNGINLDACASCGAEKPT